MSIMWDRAKEMATNHFLSVGGYAVMPKCKVQIDCSECKSIHEMSVGALSKQKSRGRDKYICKSCAGILGWTTEARDKAKIKAQQNWHDPKYAGKIQGKALARRIREESEI